MTGIRIIAAFFLVLLLLSNTARADDWYQVEVVVFEYLYPDTDGEYWYTNPLLPSLHDSVNLVTEEDLAEAEQEDIADSEALQETAGELSPETDEAMEQEEQEPVPFKILPEDNHRLEGIYRALRLSRDYRPVHHIAWQQPALDGREAKAVHLQIDEPVAADRAGPDEPVTSGSVLFDGTIRIRSAMFLHVDIDMVYFRTPPLPAGEPDATGLLDVDDYDADEYADYVSMRETRRIRLNELHYFDHPMFGVILQVSRMEQEESM